MYLAILKKLEKRLGIERSSSNNEQRYSVCSLVVYWASKRSDGG